MNTKLHIGCFNHVVEGWHNTDITPHLWIARIPFAPQLCRAAGLISEDRYQDHRKGVFRSVHYLNVHKRFPFPDGTFEAAYCSHVLEHIHPKSVGPFFAEVLRVLRPGAIFRVAVPSLALAIAMYTPEAPEQCLEMIFENAHRNTKDIHKWMYTEQSLARALRTAGFVEVVPQLFRSGRLPDLMNIDNRPENSIYVEGRKPATPVPERVGDN
jgi:predicted SAM-dependent methyltransferase